MKEPKKQKFLNRNKNLSSLCSRHAQGMLKFPSLGERVFIKANLTAKGYKASGGKLVVKNPWALDDNDLDPYTYEYFVKDK